MTYIRPILAGISMISLSVLTSCSTDMTFAKFKLRSSDSFLPAPVSPAVIAKSRDLAKDKHGMPTYIRHSERTRYVRTTAYSHMENEPGAPGRLSASGGTLKYGNIRSAAADWAIYPLGTMFKIKGLPHTYVVDDYGSELVGTNTIDLFKPTLTEMREWGTRKAEITVIQWGSYERSLALLKSRTHYRHCYSMYVRCQSYLRNELVNRELERRGTL